MKEAAVSDKVVSYLDRVYATEYKIYEQHHIHQINCYIHAVTITLEWFATLNIVHHYMPVRIVTMAMAGLHLFVSVSPCALYAAAVFLVLTIVIETALQEGIGGRNAIVLGVAVHTVSWALQVGIGHFVFDKNYPSMTKSLSVFSVMYSLSMSYDCALARFEQNYGSCGPGDASDTGAGLADLDSSTEGFMAAGNEAEAQEEKRAGRDAALRGKKLE